MTVSTWQRRIQRAQELANQYSFAAEILTYYVHVARFQEGLQGRLIAAIPRPASSSSLHGGLSLTELEYLSSQFGSFLTVPESHGPKALAELSRELHGRGKDLWAELLRATWSSHTLSDAQGLLAFAFLQPYAELLQSRAQPQTVSTAHALCPFCNRKPGLGVLRQMGDGGARSMVCSFCLAEWEFRRMVCPGCGEESDKALPVYTAKQFHAIRVECCDTCKTYIKSIDLTKNGRAEPLVDELASAPLDLWGREHGYAKLQGNLLGM
ncbi:MAG TPA: formate dehydrogenase accessory protein FdhE [Candidatus Sulfotelmatobacter sp.]|nr:formate dehydrogenase accessory protein FdhE [Candidatus Sulfotelmatobacter sp.]